VKKHGASHGAAVLICTISSALLVDVVRRHVPIMHNAINGISVFFVNILNLQSPPRYLNILIYSVILAVIWGIAFKFMHEDDRKTK